MATHRRVILPAAPPLHWASLPDWNSFWWLIEVESCPRRAALRHASYPGIWEKPGYPPKPHTNAIMGQVVHGLVGQLARTLRMRGLGSSQDSRAISILRELGGYTKIISCKIDDVLLKEITGNPRVRGTDHLRAELLRRVPQMRERLQVLLARVEWPSVADVQPTERYNVKKALAFGPHFEVPVKSPALLWKGIADLIELTHNTILIVDFKTGEPSPLHADQLLIYALLWARDNDVNPRGSFATELTLSYPHRSVPVPPPNEEQLREIQSTLLKRTELARAALQASTPTAHVGAETCLQCDVRHLCADYWIPSGRGVIAGACYSDFDDIELQVQERVGEYTWACKCSVATHVPIGSKILLRMENESSTFVDVFEAGATLRIVGALISRNDEEAVTIASLIASTEIFKVPSPPSPG